MIYEFYSVGESSFGLALVVSLLANITVQLCFVFSQYRQKSLRRILTEVAFVFTFTKPGIDAYRCVKNEHEVGVLINPQFENAICKSIELFAEAIPGTLIQTYAILLGSKVDNPSAMMFSLAVSVFTASYMSTSISFDVDASKAYRAKDQRFYRYVPDDPTKKVKMFVLMFITSAYLTTKSLACALCAIVSRTTVFLYLGIDMSIYFAYKLLRRDSCIGPRSMD